MRKFRVLLGAAALFLAAGFTFAGQLTADGSVIAYELINTGGPVQCQQMTTECTPTKSIACFTSRLNPIKENSDVESQCGRQLYHD